MYMHVLTKLTSNPSSGGLGLVSGHPHVLDLTTRLEESEHLFSRHVASQVADVDGASYLLDLGGIYVTSERGRLGTMVPTMDMRGAGNIINIIIYTCIECLILTE